jgi:hypothetical protein
MVGNTHQSLQFSHAMMSIKKEMNDTENASCDNRSDMLYIISKLDETVDYLAHLKQVASPFLKKSNTSFGWSRMN